MLLERAGEGRSFAAFVTPAALGGWVALILPALLLELREGGMGRRVALGVAALGAVASLVASASVTAIASLSAAVLLALWLNPARRALAIGALGAVVLLVGSAIALRGPEVLDAGARRGPIKLRLANYRAAAEMIRDHPLAGVGPGGFAEQYPVYLRPGDNETTHVHDLPLELAAEWGVAAGSAGTVCSSWCCWLR